MQHFCIKILILIGVFLSLVFLISTNLPFDTTIQVDPAGINSITKGQSIPTPSMEEIDMSYAIKIVMSVLLLTIGYLLINLITTIFKKIDAATEADKHLRIAVQDLTNEMKFQRQKNNQFEVDMNINRKRINRLENWKNQHELRHAKKHD